MQQYHCVMILCIITLTRRVASVSSYVTYCLVYAGARIVSGGFFGLGQGNVRSFTSRCNSDLVCIHEAKDLPDGQCGHDKDVGVFCPVPGKLA